MGHGSLIHMDPLEMYNGRVVLTPPKRRIALAGGLAAVGAVLIVAGVVVALTSGGALAAPLLICGALSFLPGVYATYVYRQLAREEGGTTARKEDWYDAVWEEEELPM